MARQLTRHRLSISGVIPRSRSMDVYRSTAGDAAASWEFSGEHIYISSQPFSWARYWERFCHVPDDFVNPTHLPVRVPLRNIESTASRFIYRPSHRPTRREQ